MTVSIAALRKQVLFFLSVSGELREFPLTLSHALRVSDTSQLQVNPPGGCSVQTDTSSAILCPALSNETIPGIADKVATHKSHDQPH